MFWLPHQHTHSNRLDYTIAIRSICNATRASFLFFHSPNVPCLCHCLLMNFKNLFLPVSLTDYLPACLPTYVRGGQGRAGQGKAKRQVSGCVYFNFPSKKGIVSFFTTDATKNQTTNNNRFILFVAVFFFFFSVSVSFFHPIKNGPSKNVIN